MEVEVSEGEFLVWIQKNQLKLFEYLDKELSLIPKAIQAIDDRSRIHCDHVIVIIKMIKKNIDLISLIRAQREAGIKTFFEIDKSGRPVSATKIKGKTLNNSDEMFL